MKKATEKQQIFQKRPKGVPGLCLAEKLAMAAALVALFFTVPFCMARAGRQASFSFAPAQAEAQQGGFVNLNQASEEELIDLPGIGPVLAERIVAWREENGPFASPEDVMEIQGIAQGIWAKIEPYVCF